MNFEQVRDIIVETLACNADQVTLEATLAEDLAADSLAIVELTMALEEATGVAIADEDAMQLKTVGDVVNYVNRQQA